MASEGCCEAGKCFSPCYDPSAPPKSRYPSAKVVSTLDTQRWKRADNAVDQFASYGKGTADPTPPYENDYTYTGPYLASCQFPLGGFGCGQVTLGGDGTLQGWTVLNQGHAQEREPLSKMPANFFAISATPSGGTAQNFILASPQNYTEENMALSTHHEAHVSATQAKRLEDLPGIKSLSLQGKYPIANVAYEIDGFPVEVSMEATTPLIPGDPVQSAIPVAVFTFTLKNTSNAAVSVRLMEAQQNFVGWSGSGDCTTPPTPYWGSNVNAPFVAADASHAGVYMFSESVNSNAAEAGNIAVSAVNTDGATTTIIPSAGSETDLFNSFVSKKDVPPAGVSPTAPSAAGSSYCAGVIQSVSVPANGQATVQFVLSWYFPNRMRDACVGSGYTNLPAVLGNRYATFYTDAKDAARYMVANLQLLDTTRLYTKTIFETTIPPTVLDSAAGRLACWRSATMWWTQDGIVQGCEGNRCCPLNCSHVYGYTTLLERMYPSLAKDMAYSNFVRNYEAGTGVSMRFGRGGWAIDGALASVIKAYMCVRQADPSGEWLRSVYPNIKDQMTIIMTKFDTDGDGCIRCPQQNTYDTAMNGANTFIGSYYITALRAAANMAKLIGDNDFHDAALARATKAARSYDSICWKEDFGYFIADVNEKNCAHSYGPGCFVDQICAAGLSFASGLGYIFDFNTDHEQRARLAIAKYNKMTMPPFHDMQKHFYPGDSGITVCTYPNGKLGNGMQYDSLVSAGFTSPVIAGLIHDGTPASLSAALDVVGYIRNRQDGRTASPWNEPECNILYSRSMAHWNLFDQACGQNYDATLGYLAFDPKWNAQKFQCFVSVNTGWGQYTQTGDAGMTTGTATLTALYGSIELNVLDLPYKATKATVTMGGSTVPCTLSQGGTLTFSPKVSIANGATLTVVFASAHVGYTVPSGSGCCTPRERMQCCPPPSSSSDCAPALRQRCCPSTDKGGAVSKGAEALQDTDTTVVVMTRNKWSYLDIILILLVGVLIGQNLWTIIGWFNQLGNMLFN